MPLSCISSRWSEYLEHIHVYEGFAFIFIDGETQPRTTPAVDTLIATLDYIVKVNNYNGCIFKDENTFQYVESGDTDVSSSPCLLPIVHIVHEDEVLTNACLQAALKHPSPPFVFSETHGGYSTPLLIDNNQTLVLTIDNRGDILSHLQVEVDLKNWAVSNYVFNTTNLEDFPSEYKDADYIEDMKYLRALADETLVPMIL